MGKQEEEINNNDNGTTTTNKETADEETGLLNSTARSTPVSLPEVEEDDGVNDKSYHTFEDNEEIAEDGIMNVPLHGGEKRILRESLRDTIFRSLSFGTTRHDSFIDASMMTSNSNTTTTIKPCYSITTSNDSVASCNTSYTSYDSSLDMGGGGFGTIRFQVVIWYVGRPDEVLSKVEMKFRVTIFWNSTDEKDSRIGYGMNNPFHKKVWKMHGRQRAYKSEIAEIGENEKIVYVPPVTIMNSSDYEVEGEPEVCLLNKEENLMKWSCVYKASLLQDNMQVSEFPHDSHDLILKLGILKHRQAGKRWDKNRWRLGLATFEDTQETICIPHGTIVDHVKVPGFSYLSDLMFDLVPLSLGIDGKGKKGRDHCLEVKLRVKRESSYFDRNIIPLLAALNIVAVSTLALHPDRFGARGQCILATSFVEIGIRMTVDSHLPVVGYQIKIQWVLNNFFFGLLFLVISSSIAYVAQSHGYEEPAKNIDRVAAGLELFHLVVSLTVYCIGSGNALDQLVRGTLRNNLRYE